MLIEILLCGAGLVVLTVAADHLVRGCARLAVALRIAPLVVGVVVIGLGTSAPEFLVSASAAAHGDTDIAVGNIVGSNIINLSLILGIAALIAVVPVSTSVITREVRLSVAAVSVFGVLAFVGLNVVTGVVLTVLLIAALALLVRWARTGGGDELVEDVADFTAPADEVEESGAEQRDDDTVMRLVPVQVGQHLGVETARAAAGLIGVLVGAQLLVANASSIATRLAVPPVVIGFTLVALGTSLPELVTTIQAQRRGESDLAVGNLFGSNVFNSLGGGAVIGFANRADEAARASLLVAIVMVTVTVLAWALLRRGLRLTAAEGFVLLAAYAVTLPLLMSF